MASSIAPAPETLLAQLRAKVNTGSVTMDDLGKLLSPPPVEVKQDLPVKVAFPVEVAESVARVDLMVGKLNEILPAERRSLTTAEAASLIEVRSELSRAEKVISDAKDAIRSAVLNHLDIEAESDPDLDAPLDSKGHVLRTASLEVPGAAQRFSWEVSGGKAKIDDAALLGLVEAGEMDREDYLAVTVPVRVFDEAKAMVHARKRPEILLTLSKALKTGSVSGALFLRKARKQ